MATMVSHPEFGSPFPMQVALEATEYRILYVGAGCHFSDIVSKKAVQVGLNIDPRQHEILSEISGPNKFAVLCDLRKLDEKDPEAASKQQSYLQELFGDIGFTSLRFMSVFGEYNTPGHFRSSPRINPTGKDYLGPSSDEQKWLSLRATTDLLASGGELVIMEFVTPSMSIARSLSANPQVLKEFGYTDIDIVLLEVESVNEDRPPYKITARKC